MRPTIPLLLVLSLGCPVAPTPGGDDSGEDTGETPGQPGDTVGPELPACTATRDSSSLVALSGVLLLPNGPEAGLLVYDQATGLITCAGASCSAGEASVVCTEGVISPGLIDPHNHLQYNSMPRWEVGPEFDDRYDWQRDDRYDDFRTGYDVVKDTYKCEIMQWAEAREVVHGTTSAIGSSGDGCIERGVRNLDESDASHLSSYDIDYSSGNVTDSVEEGDVESTNSRLSSGSLDAAFYHVAEGRNGSVTDEVDHMIDVGMVGPGQVFVHATDVTTAQLASLGLSGTGIVWSPRSNIVLYGTTTPVEIAENLGVDWAIGSDWSPSGSVGQPQELACAEAWLAGKGAPLSDVELWAKATTDAARLAGAEGVLGVLQTGAVADVAVFDWRSTPYRAVIGAPEPTVRLVVVDGETIYGRSELVADLAENPDWCETIDACGESRTFCQKGAESGELGDTLADVELTLETALSGASMPAGYEYAGALFPLFTCEDEAAICDLRAPTAGDEDGDGVPDTADASGTPTRTASATAATSAPPCPERSAISTAPTATATAWTTTRTTAPTCTTTRRTATPTAWATPATPAPTRPTPTAAPASPPWPVSGPATSPTAPRCASRAWWSRVCAPKPASSCRSPAPPSSAVSTSTISAPTRWSPATWSRCRVPRSTTTGSPSSPPRP
jgi:cytosine/adenosine deaminase-related metal-dependent hydrolase